MRQVLFILFFFFFFSFHVAADEAQLLRRIQAHAIIHDDCSAYEEAKEAIQLYPQSESLNLAYIRSTARLGKEKEMLQAYQAYQKAFPDKSLDRDLVEDMAWGVLKKASHSSSLVMQQMALLAAFFSQEMRGVNILHQGMQNSNYAIRAVAVKLAGHMRDNKLIREMKRLLVEENVWLVRQEVLEAVGKMKILEAQPQLESIIASDQTLAEEKALAISALLSLLDRIERNEVIRLSSSNRAGLRLLACEAIAHFDSKRDLDRLYLLTQDSHADVRMAAFQSIGILRPKDHERIVQVARRGLSDPHYKVSLSSAWLMTLYQPKEGQQAFIKYLNSDKKETRLFASAALAATGKYGSDLSLSYFERHPDPFVRLNLALGLAGQQLALPQVASVLEHTLANEKERWSEREWGHFQAVTGSSSHSNSNAVTTPEMENQLIRLNILNTLAILKSSHAQESIRQFLQERNWGISASAAALLLTEGDEAALELVQKLLEDPQHKVRIQAALVLSLWSHEESAIKVLEEAYQKGENDLKAKILEGIGRIGSISSIPFLINTLQEPSQTLRLIAAMAIIQCLNN
jgi:HEAT repeat protein